MRIGPLCVLARARCDAELPLSGLPTLKWCSFCFRFHCACVGRDDHRYTEDLLGSWQQWQARDSQFLFQLRLSSVHPRRDCSGSYVHPISYAGQSIGVSTDAGYLDVQCATMGLPQPGSSSLSSVSLVRSSRIGRLFVSEAFRDRGCLRPQLAGYCRCERPYPTHSGPSRPPELNSSFQGITAVRTAAFVGIGRGRAPVRFMYR